MKDRPSSLAFRHSHHTSFIGKKHVSTRVHGTLLLAIIFTGISQWRFDLEVKDESTSSISKELGKSDLSFSPPDVHHHASTRYTTQKLHTPSSSLDYPEKAVWEFYEAQKRQDFSWNVCTPIGAKIRSKLCLACLFDDQKSCFDKIEESKSSVPGWNETQLVAAVVQQRPDNCCQPVTRQRIVPASMRTKPEDPILDVYKEMVNDKSNITAWCILEGDNSPKRKWLKGFSHAAQALVPCWSYFMRAQEVAPAAKFGILLGKPQKKSPLANLSPGWTKGLVRGMQCDMVKDEKDIIARIKEGNVSSTSSSWYYRPDNKDFEDWFQYPSDATKLAKQVIDYYRQSDGVAPPTFSEGTLKIGLVQRLGARSITNMREIQERINEAYPTAMVEWGEMENLTFIEQVHFWNRQDVVVAAHGAAMTNAIFMRRRTSVVEIFPPHYYVLMYREMCEAAGIYHFAWMDDTAVPEYDFVLHCRNRLERWEIRSQPITPPVDRIVELVAKAIVATKQTPLKEESKS
jgi:hypothetical protein